MGTIFGHPFYSARYAPGMELTLPFEEQPFACLIQAEVHVGDDAFRSMAGALLERQMRFALCCGLECERLSDLINDLLEDGAFHQDGRTAVCTAHEDEPVADVMEYFALPSGVAPTNLLLTLGGQPAFEQSYHTFSQVAERMRRALTV